MSTNSRVFSGGRSGGGRVGRAAGAAVRDIAPIGGSPHKEESTGPHHGTTTTTTNIQHQIQPHHQTILTLVCLDLRVGRGKEHLTVPLI